MENKGQKVKEWSSFWEGFTPESEIQMWDYYGGRQWILKYAPRFGKVCEAGCGLGRYVFYLNRLGTNIEGLDFEEKTIEFLNNWKSENGFNNVKFIVGDVTKLPYEDNSLSGYISLGVVEHFIEGPQKALTEAYRVLRPGGVAIITTPSISWNVFRINLIKKIKDLVKIIIRYKNIPSEFFQYWYCAGKLRKFVNESGLIVTRATNIDLLYTFIEANNFIIENWTDNSLAVKLSNIFENTFLSWFGSQALTISVKATDNMHCFICGEKNTDRTSLNKYDVPVCKVCETNDLGQYYRKKVRKPDYHAPYKVFPPLQRGTIQICEISGEEYKIDELFENFGFIKKVKPDLLRDKEISIMLSNTSIQPILRSRKKIIK
ncbi:MAG: methyltransferase domain-containing protein [Bacteroidota bacterium]